MSHFTVLVAADDREDLEQVMLPYHEYECTGIEEYTVLVDVTDEAVEQYEGEEVERLRWRGKLWHPYDAVFMKNRDSADWKKRHEPTYPKGSVMVKTTRKEAGEDFAEFARDWYGAKLQEDGRWCRKTNPNKKWDWWVVGGRWTGLLLLKDDDEEEVIIEAVYMHNGEVASAAAVKKPFVRPETAENGSPGIMTEPNTNPRLADSALVGNVDWRGIYEGQQNDRMELFDQYKECLDEVKKKELNRKYLEMAEGWWNEEDRGPIVRAAFEWMEDYAWHRATENLMGEKYDRHLFVTFEEAARYYYMDREQYASLFRRTALTYAFIDTEGKWSQRGEMGWFGCDDPDLGTPDYDETFWQFVESLPDEQRVYVVDCHI